LLAKRGVFEVPSRALGRRNRHGLDCAQGEQYSELGQHITDYYEHERFDKASYSPQYARQFAQGLPDNMPIIAVMDDTICRKWGKRPAGAITEPRSKPGHTIGPTFVLGTEVRSGVTYHSRTGFLFRRGRAIPVDFVHAPSARKPRKGANA